MREVMVCKNRRHNPIFPGVVHKLPDIHFAAVESMLTAMEILQNEPFEIAEAVEDEPGYLACHALLFRCLFSFLFPAQQLQQSVTFDAA